MRMTSQIRSREELKRHYENPELVSGYIESRFKQPLFKLLHDSQVRSVNQCIRDEAARNILELAPGPARVSAEIVGFDRGVMVDNSEEMLCLAENRLKNAGVESKWTIIRSDLFDFHPTGSFDLIYTFRFLRHLQEDERKELLRRIRSWLKIGGFLIFDAVNEAVSKPLRERNPEAYKVYDVLFTKEDLVEELKECGLKISSLRSVQCSFAVQAWLDRLAQKGLRKIVEPLMRALERDDAPAPLEWIVLCQRI